MEDPLTLAIAGGIIGGASGAILGPLVNHGIEHLLKNHGLCIPECIFVNA